MANHEYLIAEKYIHENKESQGTKEFAKNAGIDLTEQTNSVKPTKRRIIETLEQDNFLVECNSMGSKRVELLARKEDDRGIWFELIDCKEDTSGIGMIKIGRGSNFHEVIKFIKQLIPTHGNFLYYCDSGMMSLITLSKETQQILNELGFELLTDNKNN